ncbi:hypothetical protein C8Q79DRAFT_763039 [Trametes meyenii]|nr:hypothetical protein C8Q79DRAFT_763039 [Trametes meyenii]
MALEPTTAISWENFLDEFLPEPREAKPKQLSNVFSFPETKAEITRHASFMKALNDSSDLFPGYIFRTLFSSIGNEDENCDFKESACCGMYRAENISTPASLQDDIDWSNIEMLIECRYGEDEDLSESSGPGAWSHTEHRTDNLEHIRGFLQHISDRQHRTFLFVVLIRGKQAQVFRIDRSGIFSTEWINYTAAGEPLAEFFWRFAHLSHTKQGHDPTAEKISHDSSYANLLKAAVINMDKDDYRHGLFKATLSLKWPWWLLSFEDQETKRLRRFAVGKPHFISPGIVGRGTRGYLALDLERPTSPPIYLKDTWRAVDDDFEKEGTTLKKLNTVNTPYVPTLEAHGDVFSQETLSGDLWLKYRPHVGRQPPFALGKYTHYRLAVKEVGKSLAEFASGYDLIRALYCCIEAHSVAYRLGIMHRNINVGNILLYPAEDRAPTEDSPQAFDGMLTDWAFSKDINRRPSVDRQTHRIGTWQFISAQALRDPEKAIEIQDELESIFHVLLYMAIRFLPSTCDDDSVGYLLFSYFDGVKNTNTGYGCGEMKLKSMLYGELTFLQNRCLYHLRFFCRPGSSDSHPIDDIIAILLSWFKSHYTLAFRRPRGPVETDVAGSSREASPPRKPRTLKHSWATKMRAKALNKSQDSPEVSVTPSSSVRTVISTTTVIAAEQANASKVATHTAITSLFLEHLQEKQDEWPWDDKKEGTPPKARRCGCGEMHIAAS